MAPYRSTNTKRWPGLRLLVYGGDRIPVSHELRVPRIGMICANNPPPPYGKTGFMDQLEKDGLTSSS